MDSIVYGSIMFIGDCYQDIVDDKILRVFPILRQVHENCCTLIGLSYGVLNAKDFVSGKIDYNKMFEKIAKNKAKNEFSEEEIKMLSNYLKNIKTILNKYSHSSFDGIMHQFLDEYQVSDVISFNRFLASMVISSIEVVLIGIINFSYPIKLTPPNSKQLGFDLKQIPNLKYIKDQLPTEIKEYLASSDLINSHLQQMFNKLKKDLNLLKK